MAKAEIKTKETNSSVEDFIDNLESETVRDDCRRIAEMMKTATGEDAKMWGTNIIGFGSQTLKYPTGRELDWLIVAFAPRKQNITLYLSNGDEWNQDHLQRLGKHKVGKGCLYFKCLSDVDETVLMEMIEESVKRAKK